MVKEPAVSVNGFFIREKAGSPEPLQEFVPKLINKEFCAMHVLVITIPAIIATVLRIKSLTIDSVLKTFQQMGVKSAGFIFKCWIAGTAPEVVSTIFF